MAKRKYFSINLINEGPVFFLMQSDRTTKALAVIENEKQEANKKENGQGIKEIGNEDII